MMAFIGAVLLTLCTTVGVMLRYAPFAPMVTPRQKKRMRIACFIASAINMVILITMLTVWKIEGVFLFLRYGMVLYAVVMTAVSIILIPGKIREHLFVFGVVSTCKHLLLSVPNFLITLIPGLSHEQYLQIILGSYIFLLLATFYPLRNMLCGAVTPFLHLEDSDYWNTIWFIPIALFGTRFLFVGGEHNSGGLVQLLSSGLAGSIIILMCLSISRDHPRMQERQRLEQQLVNQKLHYNELQVRLEDARKTRHDIKHHLAAILHFVDINDREGARNYCLDLMEHVEGRDPIPYTGNTAADGVIYHYMQRCAQKQVELQVMGVIRNPGIADMDLCVLLGNALDNALAGCMTIETNRHIQLVSQSEAQLLSILVRNTFDGKVEAGEEGLLSRKRDHAMGVGMRSMETVCHQYGGSMEVQYDENTFTVMFVLPLTEEGSSC